MFVGLSKWSNQLRDLQARRILEDPSAQDADKNRAAVRLDGRTRKHAPVRAQHEATLQDRHADPAARKKASDWIRSHKFSEADVDSLVKLSVPHQADVINYARVSAEAKRDGWDPDQRRLKKAELLFQQSENRKRVGLADDGAHQRAVRKIVKADISSLSFEQAVMRSEHQLKSLNDTSPLRPLQREQLLNDALRSIEHAIGTVPGLADHLVLRSAVLDTQAKKKRLSSLLELARSQPQVAEPPPAATATDVAKAHLTEYRKKHRIGHKAGALGILPVTTLKDVLAQAGARVTDQEAKKIIAGLALLGVFGERVQLSPGFNDRMVLNPVSREHVKRLTESIPSLLGNRAAIENIVGLVGVLHQEAAR